MKKIVLLLLVVCLAVVGLSLVACGSETTTTTAGATGTTEGTTDTTGATETSEGGDATEAEVIKIKFASEKGPTHIDQTHNFPGYFKMVEEATNGKYRFDVDYLPVNTILAPADIYQGIVDGVVEAGQSSMAYTPKRFLVTLAPCTPGVAPPDCTAAMAKAVNEYYAANNQKELDDTHILYMYPSGPGWLHNNDKIETVDQMKGKKIRVSGVGTPGVQAVGGDPIAMPMADVYEAAQKKTIDAVVSPAEALDGWKQGELYTYSLAAPYLYASDVFFVTMNKEFWDGLPADLQEAMDSISMDAAMRAGTMWDYLHNRGFEVSEALPGGHEKMFLSDAEKTKIIDLLKPVEDDYIKQLNDIGEDGATIVSTIKKMVEEANKVDYPAWTPETDKYTQDSKDAGDTEDNEDDEEDEEEDEE